MNEDNATRVVAEHKLLWFHVATKLRFVEWTDLNPGDHCYYFLKKRENDREAYGPCKMVDPSRFQMKNAQGVILNYARHHASIQLMVPVDPEIP